MLHSMFKELKYLVTYDPTPRFAMMDVNKHLKRGEEYEVEEIVDVPGDSLKYKFVGIEGLYVPVMFVPVPQYACNCGEIFKDSYARFIQAKKCEAFNKARKQCLPAV